MRQFAVVFGVFLLVSVGVGMAQAPAAAPAAPTQAAPAQLPAFDVVSVKPHKDEGMRMGMSWGATPDGMTAKGVPLDLLLRDTFDLPPDRIVNVPEWAKSSRFDIEAKVTPEDAPKLKGLTRGQRSAMLIPVLQDRFGFKFHHETRELEVYTLVVAKGGAKLKEAAPENTSASTPPSDPGKTGAPNEQHPPGMMRMRMSPQGMTLEAWAGTMASLSQSIAQQIGSTVVDKTGLTGKYDYTLSFMPDNMPGPMMGPRGGSPDGNAQQQEPVGPSIFTAVQEQLGLKLEAQKQPVDVVVIDHIEQPSAN